MNSLCSTTCFVPNISVFELQQWITCKEQLGESQFALQLFSFLNHLGVQVAGACPRGAEKWPPLWTD